MISAESVRTGSGKGFSSLAKTHINLMQRVSKKGRNKYIDSVSRKKGVDADRRSSNGHKCRPPRKHADH